MDITNEIAYLLDYVLSFLAKANLRREPFSKASNLNKRLLP